MVDLIDFFQINVYQRKVEIEITHLLWAFLGFPLCLTLFKIPQRTPRLLEMA